MQPVQDKNLLNSKAPVLKGSHLLQMFIVGTKIDFEHECEIIWLDTYLMNHYKKNFECTQ